MSTISKHGIDNLQVSPEFRNAVGIIHETFVKYCQEHSCPYLPGNLIMKALSEGDKVVYEFSFTKVNRE